MKAVRIERAGVLRTAELPEPRPGPGQVLVRIHACGVCRTDLHLLDGELDIPALPIVPGHQIVGTVIEHGEQAGDGEQLALGTRVGIPWLAWTCGECPYCRGGRENLCERARFTGRDIDGGFAELALADVRYCFVLPEGYSDLQVAPLLCAGLIGYRALSMAGEAERIGLYGFGASAHIVAQIARSQGRRVFAFTRPGDEDAQSFARELGAEWAGGSQDAPPEELDAAIIFASAGQLVPTALQAVSKGSTVVCAGIHMSDIPRFPYDILWGERSVCSVANLTRLDAREFLSLAPTIPVRTNVRAYSLAQAGEALDDLRAGHLRGAAVLEISPDCA
jgi:alcohol dehydrogenase, propanol-preferring